MPETKMRVVSLVLLLLFLFERGEGKASENLENVELRSEVAADGTKEIWEDDLENAEEELIGDKSEDEREGRDIVNDDRAISDTEDEDEDLEVDDGGDVEGDGEVTLESVRLGWDLFKEWQEVSWQNLINFHHRIHYPPSTVSGFHTIHIIHIKIIEITNMTTTR